jgi:hypothetical protein
MPANGRARCTWGKTSIALEMAENTLALKLAFAYADMKFEDKPEGYRKRAVCFWLGPSSPV